MREPMNGEDVSEINDGQKADSKKSSEIDYLKKIRKKNRMRILAAVLIVVIAVGVGLWSKVYVVGQEVEQAEFVQADVVVEDHNVSVQGLLLDTTKGVSDVAFQEKDGIVTVSLRETRKSSFHTNEFQVDYQSSEDVKQVVLEIGFCGMMECRLTELFQICTRAEIHMWEILLRMDGLCRLPERYLESMMVRYFLMAHSCRLLRNLMDGRF